MDGLAKREQFERSKINVHSPDQMKCWAHALGISKEELCKSSIKLGMLPRPFVRSWRLPMTKDQEASAECAKEARRQAALLPPGPVRDALLEKARQYELASTAKPDSIAN